ncbi:MAG: TauD/TfdA family dioxygenase [Proteobacteria bacterium]|nr:TauD/TfdA family dioxygenase [Pseudomonadota bacterium]
MRSIETEEDLSSAFKLVPLRPFGLRIDAKGPGARIADIAPKLLDDLALREKVLVLRGFEEASKADYQDFCESFGRPMLQWNFGPMLELKEDPKPENYLFSREAVPYHWDGAFHKAPTFMMFYCVQAPTAGAGGETLFCNTELLWHAASPKEQATYSRAVLTYETKKVAHYGGVATAALVQTHPATRRTTLRYAEPVETALNPLTVKVAGIAAAEHEGLLRTLKTRIYDPAFCYAHAWRERDVLIADNHSLLHGRKAFERDCPRHLRRIQLI